MIYECTLISPACKNMIFGKFCVIFKHIFISEIYIFQWSTMVLTVLNVCVDLCYLWAMSACVCSWGWGEWRRACPGCLGWRAGAAGGEINLQTRQTPPVVSFWPPRGWSPCRGQRTDKWWVTAVNLKNNPTCHCEYKGDITGNDMKYSTL